MSSGEADAVRFDPARITPGGPPPDPNTFPSLSMGRAGIRGKDAGQRYEDWQKRTRGRVARCGHCKNLIEECYVGGMVRYRHIDGVIARCPEILPYFT